MKTGLIIFYYLFLILSFLTLQSCKEDKGTIITGKLILPNAAHVRLKGIDNYKTLLSGKIVDHNFSMNTGNLPEGVYFLSVTWPNQNRKEHRYKDSNGKWRISKDYDSLFTNISLYIEKNKRYFISSTMTDSNRIKKATMHDEDVLPLKVATNSSNTTDLIYIYSIRKKVQREYSKKKDSLQSLADKLLNESDLTNYTKVANEISGLTESFFKPEVLKTHKKFMLNHPSSAITPYLITIAPDLMQNKDSYNHIIEKLDISLNKNQYTIEAKKRLAAIKDLKKGDHFPEIAGEDPDANIVKLPYGSKFTLVDFWASWCAPCRAINPRWFKLYKTYHSKGFEIIGVSFDTSRDKWKQAIKADDLPWTHISELLPMDESQNSINFNIRTIPANYLLDKDKKIVAVNIKPEEVEKYLSTNK